MTPYQTVLFDLDGTLIDSIRLILDSYQHTMAAHGIPPRSDEAWLAGVGTPLRSQFGEWSHDPALLEAMVATYRDYNLANHDAMVTAYDGIEAVLRAVRDAGLRTALVTSKNRQGARRGLDLTGLTEYLDLLVCADDVVNPKPHPEPVHLALAQLGAGTAGAVFVGDSVHDMHAGRAAGVATAAVLWGPFGRTQLEPTAPDHWLERPADVLAMLGLDAARG
jgi:pyrophosphatase PpaX